MLNSYDEVPYLSGPFAKTHPDRLATIATLHGLAPPPIDRCRVLELGCALGDNLLPMAEHLPHARFIGVDRSQTQIEAARRTAAAARLANVELVHVDLRDFQTDGGTFDYIIAHGLFSWMPRDAQEKLLAICGAWLSPNGVAFVSYNCYPGWHRRGTVHRLLSYATRHDATAGERLRHARRLAERLAAVIAATGEADALKQELELAAKQDDSYFYHEYLAEVNEPLYFHEFIERAGVHALEYLSDADFGLMSPDSLPASVHRQLADEAASHVEMEQYFDFLRERTFRQTLLRRAGAGAGVDRALDSRRLRSLYVASGARPEAAGSLDDGLAVTYRIESAAMVSREPLVKAAMLELAERWPRAVAYGDLLTAARGRLAELRGEAPDESEADSLLSGMLLNGFRTSLIELSTLPPAFTLEPGSRPLVSPLARHQARSSETVTNRRHETVGVNYVQRLMMRFLDGAHDRARLTAALVALVEDGTLAVHQDGRRVTGGEPARKLVREAIETNLPLLARLALLA